MKPSEIKAAKLEIVKKLIALLPARDRPPLTEDNIAGFFTLPELRQMLKSVEYAASKHAAGVSELEKGNIVSYCPEHAPKPIHYSGDLADLVGRYVKKAFPKTVGNGLEHMWVKVESVDGETLTGVLDNKPAYTSRVRYKDTVTVTREEIEDIIEE